MKLFLKVLPYFHSNIHHSSLGILISHLHYDICLVSLTLLVTSYSAIKEIILKEKIFPWHSLFITFSSSIQIKSTLLRRPCVSNPCLPPNPLSSQSHRTALWFCPWISCALCLENSFVPWPSELNSYLSFKVKQKSCFLRSLLWPAPTSWGWLISHP